MRVKLILLVLTLFLIVSCASNEPGKSVTYTIEENEPNTFEIEEEKPLAWLEQSKEKRAELNEIRALREDKDNLEEFEFESTYKNVRRIIDDELVIGYVKELDNPDFKEVDE